MQNISGVTTGLSQEGQNVAEGDPLATVVAQLVNTQKKLCDYRESG